MIVGTRPMRLSPQVAAAVLVRTARAYQTLQGLGECVLGKPSTDPNCFTTPAYIEALNLEQDTEEQKQNLLPTGVDDKACYDNFMAPGPNFNPDQYNRCIGAKDVTSAVADSWARAGVAFQNNPYINSAATSAPVNPYVNPAPAPAAPPPAGNTGGSGGTGQGSGSGSGSGSGGGGGGTPPASSPFDFLSKSVTIFGHDFPVWAVGAVGLGGGYLVLKGGR